MAWATLVVGRFEFIIFRVDITEPGIEQQALMGHCGQFHFHPDDIGDAGILGQGSASGLEQLDLYVAVFTDKACCIEAQAVVQTLPFNPDFIGFQGLRVERQRVQTGHDVTVIEAAALVPVGIGEVQQGIIVELVLQPCARNSVH